MSVIKGCICHSSDASLLSVEKVSCYCHVNHVCMCSSNISFSTLWVLWGCQTFHTTVKRWQIQTCYCPMKCVVFSFTYTKVFCCPVWVSIRRLPRSQSGLEVISLACGEAEAAEPSLPEKYFLSSSSRSHTHLIRMHPLPTSLNMFIPLYLWLSPIRTVQGWKTNVFRLYKGF